jgi:hypothetical protein
VIINFTYAWAPWMHHDSGESGLEWVWLIDVVILGVLLIPMIAIGLRGPLVEPPGRHPHDG